MPLTQRYYTVIISPVENHARTPLQTSFTHP
jgi:hypothetical protein